MNLKSSFKQPIKTHLIYACKIGTPDYMEEILYEQDGHINKEEVMDKAKSWCSKNGYDRLRYKVIELGKPDFLQSITI